jgi:hypothetical protein
MRRRTVLLGTRAEIQRWLDDGVVDRRDVILPFEGTCGLQLESGDFLIGDLPAMLFEYERRHAHVIDWLRCSIAPRMGYRQQMPAELRDLLDLDAMIKGR